MNSSGNVRTACATACREGLPRRAALGAAWCVWGWLGVVATPGVLGQTSPAPSTIRLDDVSSQTGIAFRHTDGSSGQRYIVETVASGLATFDYDGDGRIDVYFLNGAPLPGLKAPQPPPRNALYRNLGDWKFVETTDRAGVGDEGFGLGVAVGDYDNDGRPDIYLNNYGPNVLYRNRGQGAFEDVTARAGVGRGQNVGAGANFLDIDGDGDLDLFVANYVKFTYENHVCREVDGFPQYAGPKDYEPDRGFLFRNNGDGNFTDVSTPSGIDRHAGPGMGTIAADYDADGDTDIFVINDVFGNFLFRNDGRGNFEEASLAAGVAYNLQGRELGGMGTDCGDYDNDGRLDFFFTSYQGELPVLYRNLGDGTLEDVTMRTGAGAGSLGNVKWGCGLVDFDNDGFKDIFVGLGHLQDNIHLWDDTSSYAARPVLLRNTGRGRFVNVSDRAGDGLQVHMVARGVAFDDLDNDGDIDVVVLNSRRGPTLLRNMLYESGAAPHWLQVQLRGVKTNRDGIGAQVKVVSGGLVQLSEVHSGRGYQSHFGTRLHFGLGQHQRAERVEVRWIGGGVDVFEDLAVDRLVTLVEGAGRDSRSPTETP